MSPESNVNVIQVPLGDGSLDRLSPLALRATTSNDQIDLAIVGDTRFRNIIGEQRYAAHLDYLRLETQTTLRDRVLGKLGLK